MRIHMQESISQHKILTLATLLLFLLASVYALTYSGTFRTDDEHILASRSLSIGFERVANNLRVFGNSRLYALSILPSEYSSPAVNVEPAQAILGSFLARWAAVLEVGRIQALYLSNIYVVALTGVFIFLSIIFLGYSKSTAFMTAILFGLGTAAWPYAKTYYRDPLAMMFVSLAWACLLYLKSNQKNKLVPAAAWIGLPVSVLAGILSKNTVTLLLPVLFLYPLVNWFDRTSRARIRHMLRGHWKKIVVIGVGLLVVFILWFLFVPGEGLFTRISYPYYQYLITAFISKPHPGFFQALVGPLVSPGKSIFLYSPVLILTVVGSIKRRETAWPGWLYLFLLILGQAIFYDHQWWGFIDWGLRYWLPSLPLLMTAAAPAVDLWSASLPGRIGLLLIGIVSFFMQSLGSLAPVRQYFEDILAADSELLGAETIWTFSHSAVPWHISWILKGNWLDLALTRMGARSWPVAAVCLVTVILIIYILYHPRKKWGMYPLLGLSLLLPLAMLYSYQNDPAYYPDRGDFSRARKSIEASILPGDAVIIKAYNRPVWHHWMNWAGPDMEWISLSAHFPDPDQLEEYQLTNNPEQALDESTLQLFRELPDDYQRAWIVVPQDSPGGSLGLEETWLSFHYDLVDRRVFSDHAYQTDVNLYNLSPVR